MDARSLVFDVNDEVRGMGRLIRTQDGDWFEPPLAVALGFHGWGRPEPLSRFAIPVDGADFSAVERRQEGDGMVDGLATIYGRWLGDRISVHRQANEGPDEGIRDRSNPPCEAPPGGWPRSTDEEIRNDLNVDLGDLRQTGAAVTVSIFRADHERAVVVVAATDIAAVEALLRPQLPNRLCIVPSRWTRAQLDGVQQHLLKMKEWGIYRSGQACDEQAQASVTASPVRVTDEIADWADTLPAGLLAFEPCLTPAALTER